ncbi:hypothetical protein CDD82_4559 [Ophiocordyceps australis]|uniref:Uncharacterized protein n=1 Tax=Ophiocordyceps australis TaxID=1399860 RepID=A0A2C5Z7H8_9HYPO|nr:hypothetical protein CDD82_4559 [Ophiocordyceps australis]
MLRSTGNIKGRRGNVSRSLGERMGRPPAMKTFRAQNQEKLQSMQAAIEQSYIGSPPDDPTLIKASLVIPGKGFLPLGIDEVGVFDNICRQHSVWIDRTECEVLELYSHHIKSLQNALQAVNWALHSMSLADRSTTLFKVQEPVSVAQDATVHVDLNSRPHVIAATKKPASIMPAATGHAQQLLPTIVPAINILRTLKAEVQIRVNFGRLHVTRRKKSLGADMRYSDFADMVPLYAARGGADIDTQMLDLENANKVVLHLLDPKKGVASRQNLKIRYTLTLKMDDKEVEARGDQTSHTKVMLVGVNAYKTEKWPRINCVVASPDMKLDWSLRADARKRLGKLSDDLKSYTSEIVIVPHVPAKGEANLLSVPRVVMRRARNDVVETLLKTSVLIPLRDTPYIIEVNLVQLWRGTQTGPAATETFWTMELYGGHWDEAINQSNPHGDGDSDKDQELKDIWTEGGDSLQDRFTQFAQHVVALQALLGEMDELQMPMPSQKG